MDYNLFAKFWRRYLFCCPILLLFFFPVVLCHFTLLPILYSGKYYFWWVCRYLIGIYACYYVILTSVYCISFYFVIFVSSLGVNLWERQYFRFIFGFKIVIKFPFWWLCLTDLIFLLNFSVKLKSEWKRNWC